MADAKYSQAERLAKHSLQLRPDQPTALDVLAQAQFAQANFSGAAATYRNLLAAGLLNPGFVSSYAQALAAANRKTAAAEFREWEQTLKEEKHGEVEVAAAGLALLAGHPENAGKLEAQLNLSSDPRAVLWIGELGWWHYLNGDYQKAVDLLSSAAQQRPDDAKLRLHLAWAKMEVREYGDALQMLTDVNYTQRQTDTEMAQAVVLWRAQEHDEALRHSAVAMFREPEWSNSNWVSALYSPLVAQNVEEMKTEVKRREQLANAAAHR
jgi:tetratricopeptide (TPR) repeat protein